MAPYQQPLIAVDPAERAALEQRVLDAHCWLNRTTLELKAATAAFEQAHTAWGHALYGPLWDGTGLPAAPDGDGAGAGPAGEASRALVPAR